MDNRGKLWTIDDDQKLMEAPHNSNSYFASCMGRTENAIKCRRSHLAAKMHQNDPSTHLEEFVVLMNADYGQASALLIEWNEKRASLKNFIDTTRKRKLANSGPPPAPAAATLSHAAAQVNCNTTNDERITFICKRICDEGGNLTSLWNSPALIPCLVQNYQGFEAYARVIRVLAASGQ
jgi:hypothetical protein